MSRVSTSAIRTAGKENFYVSPYSGKQFDPSSPKTRLVKYTWEWPEKEKIFRQRMGYAKHGSRYDFSTAYSKDHTLNQGPLAPAPAPTEDPIAVLYKRAEIPKEDDDKMYVSEKVVWIRDNVLQPLQDGIMKIRDTAYDLQERIRRSDEEEEREASQSANLQFPSTPHTSPTNPPLLPTLLRLANYIFTYTILSLSSFSSPNSAPRKFPYWIFLQTNSSNSST